MSYDLDALEWLKNFPGGAAKRLHGLALKGLALEAAAAENGDDWLIVARAADITKSQAIAAASALINHVETTNEPS